MLAVLEAWTLWTFFECMFNAVEVAWIYLFYKSFFQAKNRACPGIGAFLLFLYICLLNNIETISGLEMTFLSLAGILAFTIFFFQGHITRKIFAGILSIGLTAIADFVTFSIAVAFDFFRPDRIWAPSLERFVMTFIFCIAISVLYAAVIFMYGKSQQFQNYPKTELFFIIIFVCLGVFAIDGLINMLSLLITANSDSRQLDFLIVFIGYAFLILFVSLILFLMKWIKLTNQKQELQLQTQYMTLKDEYYGDLQNALEQLRFFRHDFTKHMNLLDMLLDTGDYQKASAYLKELNDSYHRELKVIHYTNNEILNYIISNKKQAAKENHIEVRISITKMDISCFSSQEICCVFDNLFDNAIQANLKLEMAKERFIDLFLFENARGTSIIMKNRYDGAVPPIPSQEDKRKQLDGTHGYGLRILERIVSQADGNISRSMDADEHIFTIEITIPKQ